MEDDLRTGNACFDCGCSCGSTDDTFDAIAAKELRQPLKLQEICRQNIGWYCDRSLTDAHLGMWGLGRRSGLYFLWHKDEYCAEHQLFHMRALYVGKGIFSRRFRRHWEAQPTVDVQLIYFTYAELPNRLAKYAEQLVLDSYDLPFNSAEKTGHGKLCAHFSQSDVD